MSKLMSYSAVFIVEEKWKGYKLKKYARFHCLQCFLVVSGLLFQTRPILFLCSFLRAAFCGFKFHACNYRQSCLKLMKTRSGYWLYRQ